MSARLPNLNVRYSLTDYDQSAFGLNGTAASPCSAQAWFAAWRSTGCGLVADRPGGLVSSWKSWWQSLKNSWSSQS